MLILFSIFLVVSCSKNEETIPPIQEPSTEKGVEIIDGVEYVDGISQAENVYPINLDVRVEDGHLVFKDFDAFTHAIELLDSCNVESIIAWGEKIGFKSLFVEFHRLNFLEDVVSRDDMATGGRKGVFVVEDDGFVDMPLYSLFLAKVFDRNGLVQVGDYIGTVGEGLTIWTKAENKQKLIKVLSDKVLPDSDEFIVYDGRYFNESMDVRNGDDVISTSCPKNMYWQSRWEDNVHDGRKIKGRFTWAPITSPGWGPTHNYICYFKSEAIAYRQNWRKKWKIYKTWHYWAMEFETEEFDHDDHVHHRLSGTYNNRVYGGYNYVLVRWYGVTQVFLENNGLRLLEAYPSPFVGPGTRVTHRGMDNHGVAFDCD